MLSLVLAGTLMITPGYSGSRNYGEGKALNPALRIGYVTEHAELFGLWDSANKTESGAGFILGSDVLLRRGALVAGGSYRYRNGGKWVKQSFWARAGVERGPFTLLYGHDLNSMNQVRMVTLGIRCRLGPVVLEPQASVASYLQSGARHTGMVTGLWLGRAW